MSSPVVNHVVPGFSLTNRWLIYTSLMLSPTQALAGLASKSPINIGFLAYNIYQQYLWYVAAQTKQLHALSLIPSYLNMIYAITYLSGCTSAAFYTSIPSAIGTAALIMMNTITAWTSVKTNLPEGYGVYRFFFFGWRTLSKTWRPFFIIWQVTDTLFAIVFIVAGFVIAYVSVDLDERPPKLLQLIYSSIIWGPVAVLLLIGWELIMWMELIVQKNHIESETDMIAVYLFIVQVALTVIPIPSLGSIASLWKKLKGRKGSNTQPSNTVTQTEKVEVGV